jgi:hypothetical protein
VYTLTSHVFLFFSFFLLNNILCFYFYFFLVLGIKPQTQGFGHARQTLNHWATSTDCNILLYGYTFSLSVHQLVVTFGLFPLFWLFQIFVCRFWCGHIFSFLLDIYLGVKLLCHMTTLFNIWGTARLFYKVTVANEEPHQQCVRVLLSIDSHRHLLLIACLVLMIPVSMKH